MNPNSKIGMWVAFLIAPLAAIAGAFVAHAALSIFGVHLDPTGTAVFMSSVMLGLAGLAFKWLHNRGLFEIASLLHVKPAELETILKLLNERLPDPPPLSTSEAPRGPPVPAPGPPAPPQPPLHRPVS